VEGLTGEKMFTQLLELAGYSNVARQFDKEDLMRKAGNQLDFVKGKRSEQGRNTNWNVIPSALILDWVYSIDCVIDADGRGSLFGFDVTLDPSKVSKKIHNLKCKTSLHQSIGISKTAVVLLVPNSTDWGIGLLSSSDRDVLVDHLLDQVIYPMDEDKGVGVRAYVLPV
jgi:hypothetical protein